MNTSTATERAGASTVRLAPCDALHHSGFHKEDELRRDFRGRASHKTDAGRPIRSPGMGPEKAGILPGRELTARDALAQASGQDRGNSKRGSLLVERGASGRTARSVAVAFRRHL